MGCRRARPADEMVRVARTVDGTLAVGRSIPGRGAWLCRDLSECLDRARKKRAYDRALRGSFDAAQLDRVEWEVRGRTGSGPDQGSEGSLP